MNKLSLTDKKVLSHIRQTPRCHRADISNKIGISCNEVYESVCRLQDAGLAYQDEQSLEHLPVGPASLWQPIDWSSAEQSDLINMMRMEISRLEIVADQTIVQCRDLPARSHPDYRDLKTKLFAAKSAAEALHNAVCQITWIASYDEEQREKNLGTNASRNLK
jgi:predicted transcriptional regulator